MKLIGFRRCDFTAKDGKEIKGFHVYIGSEIKADQGGGYAVERNYISAEKLARSDVSLDGLLGKDINLLYNRYGKVEQLIALS